MAYIIREYIDYCEDEILALYDSVGWTAYTVRPRVLHDSFSNSLYILAAYDEDSLIGIARAIGDGHTVVYLQDVLIHPDHQRKGVGTALVRAMLEEFWDVRQFLLATEQQPNTMAFYRSLGFVELSEIGCCAFIRKRR